MKTVKERAYAKLNLFLDIVGIENGYHMLDTVVTTVDLFDVVTVTARKDKKIVLKSAGSLYSIKMLSDNQSNNAYKAAKAYIVENGSDPQFGARPLKRYIQSHAESLLARYIIRESPAEGTTLTLDTDGTGLVVR